MVAEGKAGIYFRIKSIWKWDTVAVHAILSVAGVYFVKKIYTIINKGK